MIAINLLNVGSIIRGLIVTLIISLVSLAIGAGLSILGIRGLKLKSSLAKGIIIAITQIIKGIPFLIQLFIIYYLLPMVFPILSLNSITVAVIVLTINAAVNITDNVDTHSGLLGNSLPRFQFVKIYFLFVFRELSEIIKNSTLLSLIGITELYWTTLYNEKQKSNPYVFLITAFIYLIMNLIIYFICIWMKKKYFHLYRGKELYNE